jgi:hypothetical protein
LPRRFPSGRGIFLRGDARPGFDLSQMSCGELLLLLRLWHPRGGHHPAHHSLPSRAPCAGALYALVSFRAAAQVRHVRAARWRDALLVLARAIYVVLVQPVSVCGRPRAPRPGPRRDSAHDDRTSSTRCAGHRAFPPSGRVFRPRAFLSVPPALTSKTALTISGRMDGPDRREIDQVEFIGR